VELKSCVEIITAWKDREHLGFRENIPILLKTQSYILLGCVETRAWCWELHGLQSVPLSSKLGIGTPQLWKENRLPCHHSFFSSQMMLFVLTMLAGPG
jgi:hypothetical protein